MARPVGLLTMAWIPPIALGLATGVYCSHATALSCLGVLRVLSLGVFWAQAFQVRL